jgi:hypothetical protein
MGEWRCALNCRYVSAVNYYEDKEAKNTFVKRFHSRFSCFSCSVRLVNTIMAGFMLSAKPSGQFGCGTFRRIEQRPDLGND